MMKTIHSYWAFIALVMLIIATVNAIIGYTSKKEFKNRDLRISLFTLIVMHIQLLIGLGWYFMSPWYKSIKASGIDASNRLLGVEHPIIMIIAIVLITIGWSKHKKKLNDTSKFKTIALFYSCALLLILFCIPWNQWLVG